MNIFYCLVYVWWWVLGYYSTYVYENVPFFIMEMSGKFCMFSVFLLFLFFFRGDVCWYLFNSDIYWVKMNLRNKHKKDMTFQMVKMLHKLLIKSFNYVFFFFSHLFHNLFNIIKEKRKTENNGKAFNNFHTTFHCFSTFNLCAD